MVSEWKSTPIAEWVKSLHGDNEDCMQTEVHMVNPNHRVCEEQVKLMNHSQVYLVLEIQMGLKLWQSKD